MSAALSLYPDTVPFAANDIGLIRAAKINLRDAAQRRFDSHDQIRCRVYDTTTNRLMRSDGAVLWAEGYTPYGETMLNPAANDNQGGFTSHIKDKATGLNYMQARYSDPNIGRFLSIDPMTMLDMDMNPNYFNRCSYTFNDPINAIDPTGMYVEFSDRTSEEDLDKFADYIASSDTATKQLNALSGAEDGYTIDISTENTNSNERDATNVQNRVNREMGEPTRKNYYDGRRVRTCGGVTSRTPC